MLDMAKDIQSLSHFKRNTVAVMKQMKATGHPVVLTVQGKAEVVVQDARAYQRLLELAERAEMLEFLREAKADADAGRTVPARVSRIARALRARDVGRRERSRGSTH